MNEIEKLADRYADDVYNKNEADFLSLYADEVVIFDLWDRWSYQGRAEWAAAVRAWFGSLGSERVFVKFTPSLVSVEGDWAIWCGTVRYKGVDAAGDDLRAMENRISWSLRRRADRWLIMHEHSSAPVDFATFKVNLIRPAS